MYKIVLEYEDGHKDFLGIGIYKKNDEKYLIMGTPARKYKTFDQAKMAVANIMNDTFANGKFVSYEIINM